MQTGKTDAILKPCETVRWFHLQQAVGVGRWGVQGKGYMTTKTSFRVNFSKDYSSSLRFNNVITPTSVAFCQCITSSPLPKNEGQRTEQHEKQTQKDTGL